MRRHGLLRGLRLEGRTRVDVDAGNPLADASDDLVVDRVRGASPVIGGRSAAVARAEQDGLAARDRR